ncbi:MAG: phage tail sheath family protein [Betaproteobacteria bacterium]|nr:phage tail sheath family protein [Betaproteobacteria bacterium]
MAAPMKTPGVYIVEKNAFPNSVVEVATAVPAFVGYTEKAENQGNTLLNKPWRITSMAEFHNYFGYGPTADIVRFSLLAVDPKAAAPAAPDPKQLPEPLAARDVAPLTVNKTGYVLKQIKGFYLLYNCLLHFFQNGGGPCYIVSVGSYVTSESKHIDPDLLKAGIDELAKEQEPTMVVVPEAVLLSGANCVSVQQHAIDHCGYVMKNRVAILDIWEGYRDRQAPGYNCIDAFRSALGINFLNFATAYYPWVNTTIVQDSDLTYANIDKDSQKVLVDCIKAELAAAGLSEAKLKQANDEVDKIGTLDNASTEPKIQSQVTLLAKTLTTISPFFNSIMMEMKKRLNVLPPSAAMAGIYTMVDNSRGVWKAPANVSMNSVVSPLVPISAEQQEDLNVTPQGKSINAIRAFIGEGTLVWGARTLDGNSLDWRYVNVRRTMIMLEESIRLAAKAMVFEPNTANTWVTMKSMIGNFLTGIWKRGGLAGASTEDAFSVHVGLGETMTSEDILEGILRVTVLVALVRPAEFIEITFQQQMQKS